MGGMSGPGEDEDDADDLDDEEPEPEETRDDWCLCGDQYDCPGYHPTRSERRRMWAPDDGYDPVTPDEEDAWTR
jgi:hypothetical protein